MVARRPTVTGELASFTVHIDLFPPDGRRRRRPGPVADDADSEALSWFQGQREALRERCEIDVKSQVGVRASVGSLVVTTGSIEILATITAIGLAIKSYNEVVEGIAKSVELTRTNVARMVDGLGFVQGLTTSSWQPGPALLDLQEAGSDERPPMPVDRAVGGLPMPYMLRVMFPYVALVCFTVIALTLAIRLTR